MNLVEFGQSPNTTTTDLMNQPGFNGMPRKGLVSRCKNMFPGSFVSGDQAFGGKAPYICGCRFLFKLKLKNRLDKQTKS